jgi:hypothetical protein
MKNILKLLVLVLLFTSCEDLFDPAKENIRGLDAIYKEPTYAQGILGNAYILLPYTRTPQSDLATDDAVTNDNTSSYLKMATGSWSSNVNSNPVSRWQAQFNAIQYLNIFLENADSVVWSNNKAVRAVYNDRIKGEAYGLRALHMFYLLMAHGGWTADNRLLGVPILTKSQSPTSDFNLPRNTFQECIDQIMADVTKAMELLPLDYGDVTIDQVPEKYKIMGITNAGDYNRAAGNHMRGRITGRIVEAIRAQAALLAASPAYNAGTTVTWEDAANYAAAVLNRINGVSGLAAAGGEWYTKAEVDNLLQGTNPPEILWRDNYGQSNDAELDNFPPTLYGRGRTNPTQNLVDAFPMANGYPISDASGSYNPASPYANRDPRLAKYIVFDGSKQGPADKVIITGTYYTGTDINYDEINRENGRSTRTGYYMRKLLRSDANPNPAASTQQKHYVARIRYTEIFLAYAEAANEAWGPTGTGGNAYSAYDVIRAIRQRAGVGTSNNHAYLESIKDDKDKMRELIRNERRLELCFENFRFWDLRRWKVSLTSLNETTRGMRIDKPSNTLVFNPIDVEIRDYKDYMYYGPVPYEEVQKWNKLVQNANW